MAGEWTVVKKNLFYGWRMVFIAGEWKSHGNLLLHGSWLSDGNQTWSGGRTAGGDDPSGEARSNHGVNQWP